jgi:hypothetical protein
LNGSFLAESSVCCSAAILESLERKQLKCGRDVHLAFRTISNGEKTLVVEMEGYQVCSEHAETKFRFLSGFALHGHISNRGQSTGRRIHDDNFEGVKTEIYCASGIGPTKH